MIFDNFQIKLANHMKKSLNYETVRKNYMSKQEKLRLGMRICSGVVSNLVGVKSHLRLQL